MIDPLYAGIFAGVFLLACVGIWFLTKDWN